MEGQINVTVERRNFRKRKQQLGETFDDFLCSLRELAKTCQFCNDACAQNNIRDQIIEGLADSNTVQELLKEQNLTLPNTITTCQGMEAAKKEVTIMKGTSVQRVNHRKTGDKNETKQRRKQSSPTNTDATQNSAPKSQRKCNGCRKSFHEGGRRNCPAINIECYSCGEIGHFKSVCPSKSKDNDASVNALKFNKNNRLWSISAVTAEPPAPTVLPHARAINGEADVQVLPDSGANICAAGTQFLTKLGEHNDNINESDIEPQAVNCNTMTPLGRLPVTFSTAGDKPAGDKPAGDKPAGDKPAGDKPAGDKPAGDKPAGDKPARGKPQHQRAQEEQLQEKPWEEQPQEEQFQNQRAQEERFQHRKTQVKEFQHQKLKKSSFKRSLMKSSLKKSSVDIENLRKSSVDIESPTRAITTSEAQEKQLQGRP